MVSATTVDKDVLTELVRVLDEQPATTTTTTTRRRIVALDHGRRFASAFDDLLCSANGANHHHHRPLPSSLFAVPPTPSLRALVAASSLPRRIRERCGVDDDDDVDRVVEVPSSVLAPEADDSGGAGAGTAASRPLTADLGRLEEFTRGRVGARRPFRAGGVADDDDENDDDDDDDDDDDERERAEEERRRREEEEEEILRRSVRLIAEGATGEEAWRNADDALLSVPPGVDYARGLDVDHLGYGKETVEAWRAEREAKRAERRTRDADDANDDVAAATVDEAERPAVAPSAAVVGGMWDKSYFEDDSLFGDDTDEEEDDTDDDDDTDEEEGAEDAADDDEDVAEKEPTPSPTVATDPSSSTSSSSSPPEPHDDVDGLIDALTVDVEEEYFDKSKKRPDHPLLRAPLKDRKSWAVTTPLDVSDFRSLIPDPALEFPFELDGFQKQAIARLERKECVFLAAHTSAGKTVCAEYAVALARKHCTRCVYTSPIKALSNQKYRDFRLKFGDDVGLITGDMQIGADSSCLIMTTEILRSMLYRGADLVRDIEWVVFDEVHYINDSERGVVWEEVIIMLPDHVNLIFLSATTPNTIEFSDWIGRTKRRPVHVVRTDYRPVPLSHHLYVDGKLHSVLEGRSGFSEHGYRAAERAMTKSSSSSNTSNKNNKNAKSKGGGQQQSSRPPPPRGGGGSRHAAWQQPGNRQNWTSLVRFLSREGLTPAVVFSFSKRKCEEIAAGHLRSLDLNTAAERAAVRAFGRRTAERLSPADANLPQVTDTIESVSRGVGVHHGGLLPILKEMVEILFSRGLVKVLFATETFAMGVNMPARAVVFSAIRKHDGEGFRELEPGEYTQMAGRAGRRGLDEVGTVMLTCFGETPPPLPILKRMLTGSSTKLSSRFRLTYNMILNLLRVEDMSVEGMIKRSFSEFATQRALATNRYPELLARGKRTLARLDARFATEERVGLDDVEDYYHACRELATETASLVAGAGGSGGGVLSSGRLVLVTAARKRGYARAPAIVLSSESAVVVMVLLPESHGEDKGEEDAKSKKKKTSGTQDVADAPPGKLNHVGAVGKRKYAVHELGPEDLLLVASSKHKFDHRSIYTPDDKKTIVGKKTSSRPLFDDPFSRTASVGKRGGGGDDFFAGRRATGGARAPDASSARRTAEETAMRFLIDAEKTEASSPIGSPVADLREFSKGAAGGALEYRASCERMESLAEIARSYGAHRHPHLERHLADVERRETLRRTVAALKHLLSNESLRLFPDFTQRRALLRTLGYVDDGRDTVKVKGRVACEVNTCEESLIVCEMVFEGVLNDLEPAEAVAALSALVFQERTDDGSALPEDTPERLRACCERMRTIAANLGAMQSEHGIAIDPAAYAEDSLKFGLVHVVYEWALGVPFREICDLTTAQEGSIVRTVTRLDELCREVRNCARVVGNPTLYRKMEAASAAIKRDIVFASSLYVS